MANFWSIEAMLMLSRED
uniref:Uncharacterized protein n=1 Tax=Rhizophora mucronata TaxID=61149 RepID=A0A2P2PTQ1_RHIMU